MLTKEENEKRNEILGLKDKKWSGGAERFSDVELSVIKELIDNEFIDLNDAQYYSPTNEEFYNFMVEHPGFTAHGHVISADRTDCRVSIQGLDYTGDLYEEYKDDFVYFARGADEFSIDDCLYCWWD